ncbi:bifunctional precorrin-2 dehydrogenase/sirohydrochlorin ferrochelatase [Alkalihalobacillus trypoxylicola]|uniref:precorrin-2 dehydrogenase n=1 Tax=Alkalihalobacillus trypoxylicola TaxID=519424 RepID=A0A161Q6W5_9BACI|nr:bifunctional precorrin-2 dehydrogenase/sirohydrochlorin ferrochelatase [Alkalihalobacillus trypoxylicola]KYG32138.1 hypothetical protein AZF04_05045 [Alkalihalobacillus trypoxylicola]
MNSLIHVSLKVKNKKVMIVGGGKIAERQVKRFMNAGSSVLVISPSLTERLNHWWNQGNIQWQQREVSSTESFQCDILCLVTNNHSLHHLLQLNNQHVSIIYRADDYSLSDIGFMNKIEEKHFTVAWTTHGASPIYAKILKNDIEERLPLRKYDSDLAFLEKARNMIKESTLSENLKWECLNEICTKEFLESENRSENVHKLLLSLQAKH